MLKVFLQFLAVVELYRSDIVCSHHSRTFITYVWKSWLKVVYNVEYIAVVISDFHCLKKNWERIKEFLYKTTNQTRQCVMTMCT